MAWLGQIIIFPQKQVPGANDCFLFSLNGKITFFLDSEHGPISITE